MKILKYTLARDAMSSDFGSFGNTTVVLRSPGEPELEVCRGVFESGTVLILEKKAGAYVFRKVDHPPTPR